ncbi:MAG: HEAT repeat domain-containing protein [Pirellulaceae bacterium]
MDIFTSKATDMDVPTNETGNDLENLNPNVRYHALAAMIDGNPSLGQLTAELLRASNDPSPAVQQLAIAKLEDLESPDPSQVPDILRFIQRPADSETVYWGITLIGRMGAEGAEAVPMLAGALANSPFPHVREKAAWALGQIGPAAEGALAVLQDAARQGSPRLSRLASQAIERSVGKNAA